MVNKLTQFSFETFLEQLLTHTNETPSLNVNEQCRKLYNAILLLLPWKYFVLRDFSFHDFTMYGVVISKQ